MTGCRAFRLPLAAYVDDELGVDAALEVERHLESCAACRRAVGRQRHLSRAIATLYPAVDVPAGLEARIRRSVLGRSIARRATVAAALAAALVAIVGASAWLGRVTASLPLPGRVTASLPLPGPVTASTSSTRLATAPAADRDEALPAIAAAASLHRRADDGEVGLDLVSHDVGAVNDWLRRTLPFTGSILPPGSPAITVQGATRVSLGGHPAGLVRYRMMNGREVSLFLLPAPVWDASAAPIRVRDVDFRVFQRRGLDLVGWSHAPLSYLLVSEDGLTRGEACGTCHDGNARGSIADFVTAVAGRTAGT